MQHARHILAFAYLARVVDAVCEHWRLKTRALQVLTVELKQVHAILFATLELTFTCRRCRRVSSADKMCNENCRRGDTYNERKWKLKPQPEMTHMTENVPNQSHAAAVAAAAASDSHLNGAM